MTERDIKKEIGYNYYCDMEDGRNNSETICYPSLIRILEELVDRITVQELRVDALNEQMSPRSVNEQEWVDNADRGFTDWFHSFYGPHSSRSDYFQEILKIEDPKERQDALMFWSKAAFYAGYERSLCDKLKEQESNGDEMSEFSQERFVDVGQQIFQDLVEGYHNTLHNPQGYPYGEVEDHRALYEVFAGMSFAAAEEFAKVFRHQEKN